MSTEPVAIDLTLVRGVTNQYTKFGQVEYYA